VNCRVVWFELKTCVTTTVMTRSVDCRHDLSSLSEILAAVSDRAYLNGGFCDQFESFICDVQ